MWKIPLNRQHAFVNPLDHYRQDPMIPQRNYPFEIKPRNSETFYISSGELLNRNLLEMHENLPKYKKFLFRWASVHIVTEDDRSFKARISKQVRQKIRNTMTRHPTQIPSRD